MNTITPIAAPLKNKEHRSADAIPPEARRILSEFKRKIAAKYPVREMRLFGSTARGMVTADSDLDVFIRLSQVNRGIEEDVFDMAYDIELEYDCVLDVIVLSDMIADTRLEDVPIYQNILQDGALI